MPHLRAVRRYCHVLLLVVTLAHVQLLLSCTHAQTFPPVDCEKQLDCAPPEKCVGIMAEQYGSYYRLCDVNGFPPPNTTDCKCFNLPPECQDSTSCSPGYGCVKSRHLADRKMCIHCNYAAAIRNDGTDIFKPVDSMPLCTPSASPLPSAVSTLLYSTSTNNGYTWDQCSSHKPPCREKRTCTESRQQLPKRDCDTASNEDNCYCRLDVEGTCSSSEDCLNGDRCVLIINPNVARFNEQVCVSCAYVRFAVDIRTVDGGGANCYTTRDTDVTEANTEKPDANNNTNATPSSSDSNANGNDSKEEDDVCIDANALAHVPPHDLVFPSHRRASVLCDQYGSCATAGHMVVYQQRSVMMASYCARFATCKRRVMLVNSMRMRRNVRIPSKSPDLHFTVFAARFATRIEERLLATVVHAGF